MTNNHNIVPSIDMNNVIPTIDMSAEEIAALRALNAKVAERVRKQKSKLSICEIEENLDHNSSVAREITDEDLAKGSLFEYAVVNTRDVHKDAYGVRGGIEVSHVKCKDVEEFKTAYVEAYRELCLYCEEVYQEEKATDLAEWQEHLKTIEVCGFSGSKLEQLKKHCCQTIDRINACPEDYFTEDGTHYPSLAYAMGCWHARSKVAEWVNS